MGGFFIGLTRGTLAFGMAMAVTVAATGAGKADSLRQAMSDALCEFRAARTEQVPAAHRG